MKKNIIKIENLKREFVMGNETVRALKGISFSVEEGEFVTIMGRFGINGLSADVLSWEQVAPVNLPC